MKSIQCRLSKGAVQIIQIVMVVYWLTAFFPDTLSNYTIHMLCGVIGAIGVFSTLDFQTVKARDKWIIRVLSAIFSCIVILADYQLFTEAFDVILTGVSGYVVGINALKFLYEKLMNKYLPQRETKKEIPAIIVFLVSSLIIIAIDVFYLFTCEYPGSLTADSIAQVFQIMLDTYTNHHPYWHTLIIKYVLMFGFHIFGEINAAVAVFSVFQIVCMAMIFSYAIVTIYQLKVPYKCLIIPFVWYAFMPYHIVYSITMWKDVLFGGCILLFIVSLYRICCEIGKSKVLNYVVFIISVFGFGVLRNNGLLALILTTFCLVLVFRFRYKKVLVIMGTAVVVSYILTGPFLNAIGVAPTGIQESLSIPCQQIARVVVDGEEITEEQREKIDRLLDTSRIPELYVPYVSDQIKFNIDREYLAEHKGEYLRLWIELGLEHPWSYIKGWVDQTRGYWHGGYQYWISAYYIYDNNYGICKTINSEEIRNVVMGWFTEFENGRFWAPFRAIGFHVWLTFLIAVLNFFRGDKKKWFMTLPALFIVCTLLIATPVFSEFRYAYSIFTCIPFLVMMTFCRGEKE